MGDKKTSKSAITPLVDSSVDGVIGKKFTGYLASELRGWVILPLKKRNFQLFLFFA